MSSSPSNPTAGQPDLGATSPARDLFTGRSLPTGDLTGWHQAASEDQSDAMDVQALERSYELGEGDGLTWSQFLARELAYLDAADGTEADTAADVDDDCA